MHPSLSTILILAAPFIHSSSALLRPLERGPGDRHERHRELAASMEDRAASIPLGGFSYVGDSGVSAQMMFMGTADTIYILDKTENNALTLTTSGVTHPAWGTSYNLNTNVATPMEVASNTFCAGGFSLANGTWVVFGGNQAVTLNGTAVSDKTYTPTGANPYRDADGGSAIRMITPCDDSSCQWQEGTAALTMSSKRWYPTVEGLADGSVIVLGGDTNGGYTSTAIQNNPTYEYWPKRSSGAINMNFLSTTVPLNLFPLTWLMADGRLFMQAAYKTILYNMDTKVETALPDMPHAVRVYPASAAAVMLPLTPANNYKQTILFCGGSAASFTTATDVGPGYNITAVPADDTCVRISPGDAKPTYTDDDSLPEPRSMGQLIYLPDGTLWLGNGVGMGTAGYGDQGYSVGQSYGQDPIYTPAIYNPNAPAGSRFTRVGLSDSLQERMYHSTAISLVDGSVLISGSNPNKDFTNQQWGTNYAVEKWYPLWFNNVRPVPSAFPSYLSYGGPAWNLTYTPTNSSSNPANTKIVLIRTGFSTHCMNFGQRYLELSTSYVKNSATGQVTIIASQMPPNANIFQPGPATIYLVVDGTPSIGKRIIVGSGNIETQPLLAATVLPDSQVIVPGAASTSSNSSTQATGTQVKTAATGVKSAGRTQFPISISVLLVCALFAFLS